MLSSAPPMKSLLSLLCAASLLASARAQDMKAADDESVNAELGGGTSVSAEFKGTKQNTERRSLALASVEDVLGLPRILIIGDSISIGYTLAVREALQGRANVHRLPLNCGGTRFVRIRLDKWLKEAGDEKWDVIVYNTGLHDLRPIEKTGQPITVDRYEEFLREILAKLEATGAKIIWVTTTPLPPISKRHADLQVLNDRALKVAREKGLSIADLYAAGVARQKEFQIPNDAHFSVEGYAYLGGVVAGAIAKQLDK